MYCSRIVSDSLSQVTTFTIDDQLPLHCLLLFSLEGNTFGAQGANHQERSNVGSRPRTLGQVQ
jgi:hypothetical protein